MPRDEMMQKHVTVLLATHNGDRWLPELLDSISTQTLPPDRLNILDDCSTDGTWELVRGAKLLDIEIILNQHSTNQGIVATFGELLSMAGTEYFALCDQDDVWQPDKLEKSVSLLESSGADLVYTDLKVVDKDLHEVAPSMWRLSSIAPVTGRALVPLLLKNSVTGCTAVGRTSMLKKALPFPAGIPMHDRWLGLVAAAGNGVAVLREATVLYRQHGDNEIGAARFGYRGLRSRLDRNGAALGTYLQERLDARLALMGGLQERGLTGRLAFLGWFYSRSPIVRFLLHPVYLAYIATHASVLGFRNITVDWALTCLPLGSSSRTARL